MSKRKEDVYLALASGRHRRKRGNALGDGGLGFFRRRGMRSGRIDVEFAFFIINKNQERRIKTSEEEAEDTVLDSASTSSSSLMARFEAGFDLQPRK